MRIDRNRPLTADLGFGADRVRAVPTCSCSPAAAAAATW
jgi:hypothetical protein